MLWKVPAEHRVNTTQFAAELQVYHIQFATNRKVAISLLFDTKDFYEMEEKRKLDKNKNNILLDPRRLKTCFVDAFDFSAMGPLLKEDPTQNKLENLTVPLREFINFIPWDEVIYYDGSETEPPCSETVTWIVNLKPHVITPDQVANLTALLSPEVQEGVG